MLRAGQLRPRAGGIGSYYRGHLNGIVMISGQYSCQTTGTGRWHEASSRAAERHSPITRSHHRATAHVAGPIVPVSEAIGGTRSPTVVQRTPR